MINNLFRILLVFVICITPFTTSYATLTTITKQQTNKIQFYTLNIKYPNITGNTLTQNERRFNNIVSDIIKHELTKYAEGIFNQKTSDTPINTIDISYETLMQSNGTDPILSILFSINAYYSGGVHPFLQHRVLTYNLTTGKSYVFEDMFQPESNYRAVLNQICAKKLSPITGETRQQMEENNELTYDVWNITPKGLLITFDNFAHALGSQPVLVPYSELNGFLSLKAIIKPCLKTPNPCR